MSLNELSIKIKQEQLAKVLCSFPNIEKDSLNWKEGYELYNALASLPPTILDVSGRFLYSDISTIQEGDIYLIGFNPGGDPIEKPKCLKREIRDWFVKRKNAYLDVDESWPSSFQPNVKILCSALGKEVNEICASNLFFKRSKDSKTLKLTCREKIAHGRVHKALLNIIMPNCIIAVDLKAYNGIRTLKLFGSDFKEIDDFLCHWANWRCRVAEIKHNKKIMKLIGLPSFSYPWLGRDAAKCAKSRIIDYAKGIR